MSKLKYKGKLVTDLVLENEDYTYANEEIKTKLISDGWHSFEDLYYHRMILTLALAKSHKNEVIKSKLHADGTMFEGSFIVMFTTAKGDYSYHYDLKYWELFKDIKEVANAPVYDGHRPEDVDRLLSLKGE